MVRRGDDAQIAIERAARSGLIYTLELTIVKKNEPVIEIYRRTGGPHGPLASMWGQAFWPAAGLRPGVSRQAEERRLQSRRQARRLDPTTGAL